MKAVGFTAWTVLALLGTRITADPPEPQCTKEDDPSEECTFTAAAGTAPLPPKDDDGGYAELNESVEAGKIRTSMLFATPLMQVSLSSFVDDLQGFNQRLGDVILEDYREYERRRTQGGSNSSDDQPEDTNNDFYSYQTGFRGGFPDEDGYQHRQLRYKKCEEFRRLKRVVRKLAGDLLVQVYGVVPDDPSKPLFEANSVDPWAAVHFEKTRHGLHFHQGSLSAVYYVRVPENSGRIVLHDPRGPRPPFFATEIRLTPHEGDLIMFPTWLGHEVEETGATKEPRISIPFNLDGEWEETVNARVYKLEEDVTPLEPLKPEKAMRRG